MQILPVDITALVGTILGISVVLIPIIGITARFALKPTVEAFSRFFAHQGLAETVRVLERRIDFQEHQIESLESTLRRLAEGSDFDRQLLASTGDRTQGDPGPTAPAGGGQAPSPAPSEPSRTPTDAP